MAEIKLDRLTLKNFKGLRDFTFSPGGAPASIFGDNATGKTTLYDAFLWVLFGKDSANRKDFEIKTLDATGEALHNLDHEVEAVLTKDGKPVTLRKVYKEKYTKKRGSARAEFTGHTTDHYIDNVPASEREYANFVSGIIQEDVFRLLTNPAYFNEVLPWKARRDLLLEICGDISDADVIASDKKLAKLPAILGDYDQEKYKKMIKERRAKINEELERIPIRVDECSRSLPDLTGIDSDDLAGEIAKQRKAIEGKNDEIGRIRNNAEVTEKTKALRLIEIEMLEILKADKGKFDDQVQEKKKALNEARDRIGRLKSDIRADEFEIKRLQNRAMITEQDMAILREEWVKIYAREFQAPEQATICPTCGQDIPEEQIQAALEKAREEFNIRKAEALEGNVKDGKAMKAKLECLNGEIETLQVKLGKDRTDLEAQEAAVEALQQEIAALRQEADQHTGGDAYTAKAAEKKHLEAEIAKLNEDSAGAIEAIRGSIRGLQESLNALEQAQARVKLHQDGQKRIEELEAQEKELAAEYERLEQELFLCDQFTRAKVSLMDERINSRFKLTRFKLFNNLINSGLEDICETTYQGVPYADLNHGAKLNIGLDIISTLIEFYGVSAPVFVDNAEAVTQLIDIPAQMIKLVVSGQDAILRVEKDDILEQAKDALKQAREEAARVA